MVGKNTCKTMSIELFFFLLKKLLHTLSISEVGEKKSWSVENWSSFRLWHKNCEYVTKSLHFSTTKNYLSFKWVSSDLENFAGIVLFSQHILFELNWVSFSCLVCLPSCFFPYSYKRIQITSKLGGKKKQHEHACKQVERDKGKKTNTNNQ